MAMASEPRLCISSTGGGGGKTLFALGLGRLCARKNLPVIPFKKGPDYIDAAWLSAACGRKTRALDPFFMDGRRLLAHFQGACAQGPPNSLALIEGNRGLYDGLDSAGSFSTACLARVLKAPLILCLNCAKSTRTIAALLLGLTTFEKDLDFGGVIFNNVGSRRHEMALREAVKAADGLPVLGALPRLAPNPLPERHMGLAGKGGEAANGMLEMLADMVENHCDLSAILQLAASAPPLPFMQSPDSKSAPSNRTRIGFLKDDAFWFYYPENLAALEEAGAQLVPLSITGEDDAQNWREISGLYLGGGFPEDFGDVIAASPRLSQIRELAKAGLPIYAECGGLMLLCRTLINGGKSWPMAGIFPLDIRMEKRPQGLGYVEAEITGMNPFFRVGYKFRGHEFHYSRPVNNPESCETVYTLARGKGLFMADGAGRDGLVKYSILASYAHIYAPAASEWARNFVALARDFRRNS